MGIRNFDLNIIKEVLQKDNKDFNGLKIMQLGDQMYREKGIRAKEYLESLGSTVVSIDINGLGGSLPIDLSKIIDNPEYQGKFDLITNCGTSEHVSDHLICFENIYNFCSKNGIIYNIVPKKGCWNRGCHRNAHKYDIAFFEEWAKDHFCEILISKIVTKQERFYDDMVMAVLKKG